MSEIGSEFWNVITTVSDTHIFPNNAQWYISGRSALQAIVKDLYWAKSVAMPSWCCDSMVKPFVDAGIRVDFYPVYFDSGLVKEESVNSDVLFIMDYFGYTADVVPKHPCIIRDVTHSIFSKSYSDADYYFGSLRKWCGVWSGGYAWTGDGHSLTMEQDDDQGYIALRRDAMKLKDCYINQKTDQNGKQIMDKSYLQLYNKAEELLDNIGISPAASRDVCLASKLDSNYIIDRRKINAKIIMNAFPELLIFPEVKESDCPMFVPILLPAEKRNGLRQYLIKNDIYCPIHWPVSNYHRLDERTRILYDSELSLVCDQRYSEKDMYHMIDIIDRFFRRDSSCL